MDTLCTLVVRKGEFWGNPFSHTHREHISYIHNITSSAHSMTSSVHPDSPGDTLMQTRLHAHIKLTSSSLHAHYTLTTCVSTCLLRSSMRSMQWWFVNSPSTAHHRSIQTLQGIPLCKHAYTLTTHSHQAHYTLTPVKVLNPFKVLNPIKVLNPFKVLNPIKVLNPFKVLNPVKVLNIYSC